MKLTDYSIKHSTTVLVLIILILAIGINAYLALPREAAPDIQIPQVNVITNYEGVSPTDIESLITRPIERKIKGISSVKEIRSVSAEGVSNIMIEFDIKEDIDTVLQKVKDKVDQAKGDLPTDLEDDPIVNEINIAEFPIVFINITGEIGLVKLKEIAEDLEEKFETINGVLDADVVGGLEREIHIEFDPDRLVAYGLSAASVIATVSANNQNTPGGSLKIGEAKYTLKVPAEFKSPAEVYQLVVATRNGKPIYLTDICTVTDSYKERDSLARVNGKQAVTVTISKRSGENLLRIIDQAKAILAEYPLPPTVQVAVTSDQSKFVRDMVSDLENNILTGLILVLAVILVALGGRSVLYVVLSLPIAFLVATQTHNIMLGLLVVLVVILVAPGGRSAVFVSLAIPFSMLIAFAIVQAFGMTLNMIVLFSLILALGMLVDNAIVIVENIYRHKSLGKTRQQAALDGAREVAWPVTASTLTTIAAFAPLVFWPDVMGEFMGYLPKTVIIALTASLFVALVINPALCARYMRGGTRKKTVDIHKRVRGSLILRAYRGLLQWSLGRWNRLLVLAGAFAILFGTIMVYGTHGHGVIFFPETDPQQGSVDLRAPEGTRLEIMDEMTDKVEKIVAGYHDMKHFTTNVGAMGGGDPFQGGGGNEPNRSRLMLEFLDAEDRTSNSSEVIREIRERLRGFVGSRTEVEKQEHGPPTGPPIYIEISGDDFDTLSDLADNVQEAIKDVPGAVDLHDDYIVGRPEIKILIDKERAALFNLTAQEIGFFIRTAMSGSKVGVFREGEDEYDIIVRLPEEYRQSIADLERLCISDMAGNQIPLSSLATIERTSGLGTIKRIDQTRTVSVIGNTEQAPGRTNNDIRTSITAILAGVDFPPGYTWTLTGESEEQDKATAFLSKAFIVALLMIALVLVTEFNSVLRCLIIMTSVVLSLIGVLWGLIITATPFSIIMTGLGVISLAGIVVNNAIVLIDYVQQLRDRGMSVREALVEAGLTRFRPVMLTAVTTVLGLLPMAVGVSYDFRAARWVMGSESAQWWGPMAVAVIFGLVVSTVLTLIVVPTTYSLIESMVEIWGRIFKSEEGELPAEQPEGADVSEEKVPAEEIEVASKPKKEPAKPLKPIPEPAVSYAESPATSEG